VKQKNCNCSIGEIAGEGQLITHSKGGGFYGDDGLCISIEPPIPKKFQSTIPIDVRVCIELLEIDYAIPPGRGTLTCIEKLDK